MDAEQLEPTLSEKLEATEGLLGDDDQGSEPVESRRDALRARMNGLRKRLVIKEPQRRWWQRD